MNKKISFKALYRSNQQHLIAGVCSGIADYFNIDPNWIRALFLLSFIFFFATTIVIYSLFWILLPVGIQDHSQAKAMPSLKLLQQLSLSDQFNQPLLLEKPMSKVQDTPVEEQDAMPASHYRSHHSVEDVSSDFAAVSESEVDRAHSFSKYQRVDSHDAQQARRDNDDVLASRFDAEFPEDFLTSWGDSIDEGGADISLVDDARASVNNSTTASSMSDEFPAEFLASFEDDNDQESTTTVEPSTSSSLDEFPAEFLATMSDASSEGLVDLHSSADYSVTQDIDNDESFDFPDFSEEEVTTLTPQNDKSLDEFPAEFLDSLKDHDTAIDD